MRIELVDNLTKEIICRGELVASLDNKIIPVPEGMMSIDTIYFFNVHGGTKYTVCEAQNQTSEEDHIDFHSPDLLKTPYMIEKIDSISTNPQYDFLKIDAPLETPYVKMFSNLSMEVVDKKTNETITRGKVTFTKTRHYNIEYGSIVHEPPSIHHSCNLITPDGKHFFWTKGCSKYSVRLFTSLSDPVEYIERPDYIQVQWKGKWRDIVKADVIRDYSIDECDPEIQGLVYALNKIPFVHTNVSCCGHGTSRAWVSVACEDVEGFYRLMDILKDPTREHHGHFHISVSARICTKSEGRGNIAGHEGHLFNFSIETEETGTEAYIALKHLEDHINEIYGQGVKE